MLSDLKLVIRLQEIDNRLAVLAREIASLPKHVAEIEKKLLSPTRKSGRGAKARSRCRSRRSPS
jgi:hypothetical protein